MGAYFMGTHRSTLVLGKGSGMTRLMRLLSLSVAMLALTAAAQAEDRAISVPASIKQAGKIVVGTSPTYPPLEYKDPATQQLMGLDIDLGNEIAKRLGVKIEWQEQSFSQLIPSLDTGRIDMGASGMTDIPARREKTDFVDYFSTGTQIFTFVGMAAGVAKVEDLCGKPVAINRTSIFYIRMMDFSANVCKPKGLPDVQYVLVDKTADARLQLLQQRAVAAAQGIDAVRYLNEHEGSADKGKFRLIGEPIAVDYAGFGFSKNRSDIRDAVAAAVDAMIADGSYARIFAKWELPYAEMKHTMINAEPRAQ